MKIIGSQQALVANHQAMMQVPQQVWDCPFNDLYESIMIETMNLKMEEDVPKLELLSTKRELKNTLKKDLDNNYTWRKMRR
jgi:hypothetical protein